MTCRLVLFGLFWGHPLQSRTQGANSDSADMVLQGWDMVKHGNLLLRGWVMADVSFYTFEIPIDGLVSAVYGLRTDVIHVAVGLGVRAPGAVRRAAGGRGGRRPARRQPRDLGTGADRGRDHGRARHLAGLGGAAGRAGPHRAGVPVLITLLVAERVTPAAGGRPLPPWR